MLRFEYTQASHEEMLAGHLLDVARQCNNALFQQSQPARHVVVCAALAHDVGQATPKYQAALRQQQPGEVGPAASCGALWSWWLSGRLKLWQRVAATAAVLGHHGQLHSPPTEQIQQLARDARDGTMLRSQLEAMDVAGVGQFLQDSGSRFFLAVPTTIPGRQQLLDTMPEDQQLASLRHGDLARVEEFMEEHLTLLSAAHGP